MDRRDVLLVCGLFYYTQEVLVTAPAAVATCYESYSCQMVVDVCYICAFVCEVAV